MRFTDNSEGAIGIGCYVMSIGLEITRKYSIGAMYDNFGASKTFVAYTSLNKRTIQFRFDNPPQSAPGSPSKASELYPMMLNKIKT